MRDETGTGTGTVVKLLPTAGEIISAENKTNNFLKG